MPTPSLLTQALTTGNPVLGENTATFIWQGKKPVALTDDSRGWEQPPRLLSPAGPGLWKAALRLPSDAYVEYAYFDPESGERLPDPLNPNRTWTGFNDYNHYFYMPAAQPTGLVRADKNIARGTLTRHRVETRDYAAGSHRTVLLYQPPVRKPVPLLVVLDGTEYLRRARLDRMVDNLIAARSVRPFAMAFVQNSIAARTIEYSCSEATLGFLTEAVLPLARRHMNLASARKQDYGILGASLGGLMAVYSGLRLPSIFGKVLSQSGAFRLPEGEFVVMDLVRHLPVPETEFWLDVGRFDMLLDGNREMAALMKERGYQMTYREFSGGHNYTAWRDDLWRGLEMLFGS
jgi:enterochelin esterase-like enzyme